MTLSANPTLAQATAAYNQNAPPFKTVEQCELFINACAVLINLVPQESGTSEGTVRFQTELYLKQQRDAETWRVANSTPETVGFKPRGRVIRASFRNFRD